MLSSSSSYICSLYTKQHGIVYKTYNQHQSVRFKSYKQKQTAGSDDFQVISITPGHLNEQTSERRLFTADFRLFTFQWVLAGTQSFLYPGCHLHTKKTPFEGNLENQCKVFPFKSLWWNGKVKTMKPKRASFCVCVFTIARWIENYLLIVTFHCENRREKKKTRQKSVEISILETYKKKAE